MIDPPSVAVELVERAVHFDFTEYALPGTDALLRILSNAPRDTVSFIVLTPTNKRFLSGRCGFVSGDASQSVVRAVWPDKLREIMTYIGGRSTQQILDDQQQEYRASMRSRAEAILSEVGAQLSHEDEHYSWFCLPGGTDALLCVEASTWGGFELSTIVKSPCGKQLLVGRCDYDRHSFSCHIIEDGSLVAHLASVVEHVAGRLSRELLLEPPPAPIPTAQAQQVMDALSAAGIHAVFVAGSRPCHNIHVPVSAGRTLSIATDFSIQNIALTSLDVVEDEDGEWADLASLTAYVQSLVA